MEKLQLQQFFNFNRSFEISQLKSFQLVVRANHPQSLSFIKLINLLLWSLAPLFFALKEITDTLLFTNTTQTRL